MGRADEVAERRAMHEVVAGHSTKADKIRALDGEGYSRVDIAKYLEIRYQHVRNVLVGPKPARTVRSDVTSSGERRSKAYVSLGPGGRIVIPATFRHASRDLFGHRMPGNRSNQAIRSVGAVK